MIYKCRVCATQTEFVADLVPKGEIELECPKCHELIKLEVSEDSQGELELSASFQDGSVAKLNDSMSIHALNLSNMGLKITSRWKQVGAIVLALVIGVVLFVLMRRG